KRLIVFLRQKILTSGCELAACDQGRFASMEGDEFAQRLAGVWRRFASKLSNRIAEIDAVLPELIGNGAAVVAAVSTAHRKVHDLCGIGPTLGFIATGQAARTCERVLLQPSRAERGLTDQEMADLRVGLLALRTAAQSDMQVSETGAVQP